MRKNRRRQKQTVSKEPEDSLCPLNTTPRDITVNSGDTCANVRKNNNLVGWRDGSDLDQGTSGPNPWGIIQDGKMKDCLGDLQLRIGPATGCKLMTEDTRYTITIGKDGPSNCTDVVDQAKQNYKFVPEPKNIRWDYKYIDANNTGLTYSTCEDGRGSGTTFTAGQQLDIYTN